MNRAEAAPDRVVSAPGPTSGKRRVVTAPATTIGKGRVVSAPRRVVSAPLRPDQERVVEAFLAHLASLAGSTGSSGTTDARGRWTHIVLPPRTGKTVIAAHIAQRCGLAAAFVVPTRVLVHQTRREFARHAPGVPIGAWYGDEKACVEAGVNLTTHMSLRQHRQSWPAELSAARLVFVDEAHHALTAETARALADAFPPDAVRVALTATPDYDERRRLDTVFPHRIARVEIQDALAAELLAPARVYVAEVDVDASEVEIIAGDFREDQLARIMGHAPFLHSALTWRYQPGFCDIPCLVACVTRQQATELVHHFRRHRPPGSPPPALILGETPEVERERILAAFEAGRIDTLVQVGVLVEGWTSARCKLLLDLAPGRSRVRATQKYFRVLTRSGDVEAHIFVLVPRSLPRPPLLPMDLLLAPGDEYTCGESIGGRRPRRVALDAPAPLRGVRLVQRLVVTARFGAPQLDPAHRDELRAVLASSAGLGALPGRQAFEAAWFHHPLFSGTGRMLLRWLGVSSRAGAYEAWLASIYPEEIATRLLGEEPPAPDTEPWTEASAWLAVDMGLGMAPRDPESILLHASAVDRALRALERVGARSARLLRDWCGLDAPPLSIDELGDRENLSRERMRQLIRTGAHRCRNELFAEEDAIPDSRGRDSAAIEVLAHGSVHASRHPLVQRAQRRLDAGDPTGALGPTRRMLDRFPSEPTANDIRARALLALGRADEARPHIEHLAGSAEPGVGRALGRLLLKGRHHALLVALTAPPPGKTSSLPPWWAAHALWSTGQEETARARLAMGVPADAPSRYHCVLLECRAGRSPVYPVLDALLASRDLGLAVLERHEGGSSEDHRDYLGQTLDLWRLSPSAQAWLGRWLDDPEVTDWVASWRTGKLDQLRARIPALVERVAPEVGGGLGGRERW